jgi:hypothetical protein
VGTCAEGPSRIQIDDKLAGRRRARIPARANGETATHTRGAEELLPHVSPLALVGLALADGDGIDGKSRRSCRVEHLVSAGKQELAILRLAQRDHGGATYSRRKKGAGIAQFNAAHQRSDLGSQNFGCLGLGFNLDFEPGGQRITRLLASRLRRLRASRILRFRLTEGFSW